jgi:outer membrane protein assembly factor BamB
VLSAQRLRNGNTFIGARGQLQEIDKDGKEVWVHNQPNQDIVAAQKLRDGSVMFMTYNWQVTRFDPAGKEQKTFRLPPSRFGINQNAVEFLSNDRVLVVSPNEHKVSEYDSTGKVVWEASVQFPNSAVRLSNGRTLVSSTNQMKVMELDRAGKVVWEHKDNMRPFKVRKR